MQRVRTTTEALRGVAERAREPQSRILVMCEDDQVTYHYAREFFAEHEAQFESVDMTQYTARDAAGGLVQFGTFTTDPRRWNGPQWSFVVLLLSFKTLTILEALENIRLGLRLGPAPGMLAASTDN